MKKFFESSQVRSVLRILLAVLIGLTLGFIVTLFVSEEPVDAYRAFLFGPLTQLNRIGDWLEESLTLKRAPHAQGHNQRCNFLCG